MGTNNMTETGWISKTGSPKVTLGYLVLFVKRKCGNELCDMSYFDCTLLFHSEMFMLTTVLIHLQYDSVSCCSQTTIQWM